MRVSLHPLTAVTSVLVTAVTQVPPPIENPFIVRSLTEVSADGHAAPQRLKLLAVGQEIERFGATALVMVWLHVTVLLHELMAV